MLFKPITKIANVAEHSDEDDCSAFMDRNKGIHVKNDEYCIDYGASHNFTNRSSWCLDFKVDKTCLYLMIVDGMEEFKKCAL